MSLFRKDLPCDSCGVRFPRRELSLLGGMLRGGEAEKQKLCRECLKSRMTNFFRTFRWKAAAVHPAAEHNSYRFYAFEQMPKLGVSPERIERLQNLLPSDGSVCERCGAPAPFSWIPSPIRERKASLEQIVDLLPGDRSELLCERCVAAAFAAKVDELGLSFAEVLPPVGGPGLLTPIDS